MPDTVEVPALVPVPTPPAPNALYAIQHPDVAVGASENDTATLPVVLYPDVICMDTENVPYRVLSCSVPVVMLDVVVADVAATNMAD